MSRPSVPDISLVLATFGPATGLPAFLAGLREQGDVRCELIVVDQNRDTRIAEQCRRHVPTGVDWRLLTQSSPGLAAARNAGLACARGGLVAFPDDDCVYPPGLLPRVRAFFAAHPEFRVLTGCPVDPGTLRIARGQAVRPMALHRRRLLSHGIAFAIFARREPEPLPRFDAQFGTGARFGAAEESDWLHRLLAAGARGFHDPALAVWHPDPDTSPVKVTVERYRRYGEGLGAYARKHLWWRRDTAVLAPALGLLLLRPAAALFLSLFRREPGLRARRLGAWCGRWRGFLAYDRACYEQSRRQGVA